jgi:selenocysteine lyase/cysteine desulfurase
VIPINDAGELLLDEYRRCSTDAHPARGVTHVSNALGTINPVKEMIALAHEHGVPVLVDGAQAAPHMAVDVQALDCDFYAFSGHKMCGPTGVGVLYGKAELLEKMQPFKGGGDMILSVTFEKTTYNAIPHKFEAGTPPIAAAIGLGAAIDYLRRSAWTAIARTSTICSRYATRARVAACRACASSAPRAQKAAVLSFVVDGRASARRGHAAQRGRRRDAHRASLRAAGDAALRRAGDRARVVRVLQHHGRGRCAGRGHPQGAEGIRLTDERSQWQTAALPGSDPRSQPQAAQLGQPRDATTGRGAESAVRRPHLGRSGGRRR